MIDVGVLGSDGMAPKLLLIYKNNKSQKNIITNNTFCAFKINIQINLINNYNFFSLFVRIFQITDQNTTMPAMPTEKSSILAESNYSDLRMKDNLGIKREMDTLTTGRTTTTTTTTTNTTTANTRLTHNPNCETDNKAAESGTTASTPTQNTTNKSNKIRGVNDFRFGISIGEGSFSTVYLAKDIHTNKEYASKYTFT